MDPDKDYQSGHRLLIVDDEPNIRKILNKILSKNSPHIIESAFDGINALEKLSEQAYDLMIIDLKMPRMDGETLVHEVRKQYHELPLIILTGHGELTGAYKLLKEYRISDFLTKPLQSPMQLLFSVQNALEKSRLRRELQEEVRARKQVDDALQENRRVLVNLMSNLPGMVYRRQNDSEWSMEFVSEGCYELTGCQPEEMLSGDPRFTYTNLIHSDDLPGVKACWQEALAAKTTCRKVYRIITPKDRQKWVWEQGQGVYGENGELLAVEGFITDISKQKEAEQKLEKAKEEAESADKAKTEFIAKMSHEMRTPLNAIIGFSELSLTPELLNTDHPYTSYILVESKILLELINSLLDHAKIATGKFQLEIRPFNLHYLMMDLSAIMQARAGKRNLDFFCEVNCSESMVVEGDPARLRQILHNLLNNAIKFTESGYIKIQLDIVDETDETTYVKFSVEDSGIGIALERQPYIFESFNQANPLMTQEFGGTGLGTTISKELTELMNGEIDFDSVEREGSTFWIKVPLKKVTDKSIINQVLKEQELEDSRDLTKKWNARVLLAEDYKTNQMVAIKNLEIAGCTVELAENGQQAIDLFEQSEFDLVLMDLNMPVMDGFAASLLIREKEKQKGTRVPIIAYTANVYEEDQAKCVSSGMDDFLGKPIKQKKLYAVLEKWLDDSLMTISSSKTHYIKNKAETRAQTNEYPMDKERALVSFAGDAKTLDYVIGEYFKAMEEQFVLIRQAIEQQDFETVSAEAHSIKGGAMSLAADDLAQAALKLEKTGSGVDTETIASLLKEVENQKHRLKTFYETIRSV